jgi:hypothetical protein
MLVSNDLLVFERRYVFVEEVYLASDGVVFMLSPRHDLQNVSIAVKAWDSAGKQIVDFFNANLPTRPSAPSTSQRWRTPATLPNGSYLVEIQLEGHLAFNARLGLGGQIV